MTPFSSAQAVVSQPKRVGNETALVISTAHCCVCGELWDRKQSLECFSRQHADCQRFLTLARATFKRLGWNRYLWGAFYSDNMWDLEQQEANEQG